MTQRHCYLLVEGRQDVFFVGRILGELGLQPAQRADQISTKWEAFFDQAARQRDEAERAAGRSGVPFWQIFKPACLFGETHSVVIERVDGNRAKFGRTLRATDALIDGGLAGLTAVGLLPDADRKCAASLASAQAALESARLPVPQRNEEVIVGAPNTGIFVLPGGDASGGLEELLIDCAATVYPALVAGATTFVEGVDVDSEAYIREDMTEMKTPQGPRKAIVGCVASVLKPGSTAQLSVLRDRWVSDATLSIPRVAAIAQFLKALCGLP